MVNRVNLQSQDPEADAAKLSSNQVSEREGAVHSFDSKLDKARRARNNRLSKSISQVGDATVEKPVASNQSSKEAIKTV